MAARHGLTADEACRRLERVAASLGISDTLLADLIVLEEIRDRC